MSGILVNMVLRVRQTSPNFARLRQSSHEGARMLLVHHGTCLLKGKVYSEKNSAPQVLKHGGAKLPGEWMRCPPPPQRIERHKSTTDLFQFFCLSEAPQNKLFPNLFLKVRGNYAKSDRESRPEQ